MTDIEANDVIDHEGQILRLDTNQLWQSAEAGLAGGVVDVEVPLEIGLQAATGGDAREVEFGLECGDATHRQLADAVVRVECTGQCDLARDVA